MPKAPPPKSKAGSMKSKSTPEKKVNVPSKSTAARNGVTYGNGTADDPWVLKTPSLSSEFQAWRDEAASPRRAGGEHASVVPAALS